MGSQRPREGKIRAGIIQESLMLDPLKKSYQLIQEAVHKYSNISLEYVEISKYDLSADKIIENSELPMEMDVLFMPFDYSLLASYEKLNISRLTKIFLPSFTFLMSPAPDPIINTSLSFLAIESIVSWLLVLFLFLVSAVMTLAIMPRTKVKPKSSIKWFWQCFKNFPGKFKAHLWQNVNLLFCEGYPSVPRSLPWRIAFMSWLLVVMLVTFEISSYLKSEFSETKYVKVDTIDDLLEQAGKIKIGIMEGGVEDTLFAKRALTEEKYRRLQDIFKGDPKIGEKMDILELFTGEVFEQVAKRNLIFVCGRFAVLPTMSNYFYSMESSSLFDFSEMYYLAKPLDQSYSVAIFSHSFVGTPFSAVINEMLILNVETQLAHSIIGRTNFLLDILQWSEPAQLENSQLTMKGAESVIVLYLIGNAIAIAYLLISTIAILFFNLYKI